MNHKVWAHFPFAALEEKLIELLSSLSPEEWQAQTVAKKWKVKDVAAHLLDNNIRALSLERDRYFGTEGPSALDFGTVVTWLNRFNNDWVDAAKRISPAVMVFLLQVTSKPTVDYLTSVDPDEQSVFPVDWAGENKSTNRLHIARHYTERFLHQQQIRDAVGRQGLMTREFFYPFIDTFALALPHTYRDVNAEEGTAVKLVITSEIGGSWTIEMIEKRWQLMKSYSGDADAEVIIDPDTAWKLFSKSIRPHEVRQHVTVNGKQQLGEVALNMVSVMA